MDAAPPAFDLTQDAPAAFHAASGSLTLVKKPSNRACVRVALSYNKHMSTTQYRVVFTQPAITSGDVEYSTKWFDSLEEAQASRWMNQENAKIVIREYHP